MVEGTGTRGLSRPHPNLSMKKLFTLIALCYAGLTNAQVPTNGLVGEYLFTSGSLSSTSGAPYTGSQSSTNISNSADRFNAANNAKDVDPGGWVSFGDVFDDVTTGANATFTYSFWVKLDAFDNAYKCIFAKATFESTCSFAGRQYAVLINPQGEVQLQAFGALTGGHARVDGNTTLTVGTWHHIVISVDMATLLASLPATTGLNMYVDGALQTNTVSEIVGVGISTNGMDNGPAPLGFGTYLTVTGNGIESCVSSQNINGQLDDFRIYDRTVDANEVQALFSEGGCPPADITTQPVSSVGICEGSTTATISVAVAGQTTTILWQYNDGNGWGDLTGETGTDLEVALDGDYRAQLSTDCGTISYSDICSVAGTGPEINTPLASTLYICPSVGSRDITIDATGQNITYQWQSSPGNPGNMADIQGATNATYSATAAQTYYQVIVSACGVDVISNQVVVQNGSDNSITVTGFAPGLGTICIGQSVTIVTQVAQSSSFVWSPANGTGNGQYLVSPTETTTYTVTATSNTFGCSATTTATVTVNNPEPVISENMGMLELTGGTFFNVQWYVDGSAISGANNYSYTPTADGNYTVSVTESGCNATSAPYAFAGLATGIYGVEASDMMVYPNPFGSELVVEVLQPTILTLHNVLGEEVLTQNASGRTVIGTDALQAGIYFIRDTTTTNVVRMVKH